MDKFRVSKISLNNETIAEALRNSRLSKKLDISEVAHKLKIDIKYLKALEEGSFGKLPKGVYGKNFLREYADFLGLNSDELIELFIEETANIIGAKREDLFSRKVPQAHYFLSIPKILKNLVIFSVVLICILYLVFYLNKIISPPVLTIINPAADLTINENFINIEGITEKEVEVLINGEFVLLNQEGHFAEKVNLKQGINTITVEAQKKYSRKNVVIRKILVK